MSLSWVREKPSHWDDAKSHIIGDAEAGIFDRRFSKCKIGDRMPGDWWRVDDGEKTVGFAWLDVVWGDAEIQLAVDKDTRGSGVGGFILEKLESEALEMGINYLYNSVRPSHPNKEKVTAWLEKNGFSASEDGSLFRTLSSTKASG